MYSENEQIVDFHKYCHECKHETLIETEEPCAECLGEPINDETAAPIHFVRKD